MLHPIKMSWKKRAICGPQVSPGEQAEGKPSTISLWGHAGWWWQFWLQPNKHISILFLPPENLCQPSVYANLKNPSKLETWSKNKKPLLSRRQQNKKRLLFSGHKKRITHFKHSCWHFHEKTNLDDFIYCLQILNDLESYTVFPHMSPVLSPAHRC